MTAERLPQRTIRRAAAPSGLRVRPYRAADLAAVVGLFQRTVRTVNARDYSPEQIAAWAPDAPDPDAWAARLAAGGVFVCERAGTIAGFARVEPDGTLDLLYVDAGAQRAGVGRRLLDRAVRWAAARGAGRIAAAVSVTARPFFERAGFRVVRRQSVARRGVALENFVMERPVRRS